MALLYSAFNQKIDFHSHFLSPTYLEYLEKYEGPEPDHFPTPAWDLEDHIAQMDQLGIAVSLISVSSPNLSGAGREIEKTMVRQINLEGWSYVKQYPERLGLMASLPLPYVKESMEEAEFALRDLHADGFGLSTHYAGIYLGNVHYDPLMAYLNEVGAVVVVHPVEPAALPKDVNRDVPIPAMEFYGHDAHLHEHGHARHLWPVPQYPVGVSPCRCVPLHPVRPCQRLCRHDASVTPGVAPGFQG